MTNKNKYLALSALGFFMTGCTGIMTKTQAGLSAATFCGVAAGAGTYLSRDSDQWIAAPAAVGSALLCGGLAYLLTEDPKTETATATATATTTTSSSAAKTGSQTSAKTGSQTGSQTSA